MKQVLTHRMHCCALVTENESNRGNKRERENNSKKQGERVTELPQTDSIERKLL